MRAQHLVLDLHLVRRQEEPARGEQRRGHRPGPRMYQAGLLQRGQAARFAHHDHPRTADRSPGHWMCPAIHAACRAGALPVTLLIQAVRLGSDAKPWTLRRSSLDTFGGAQIAAHRSAAQPATMIRMDIQGRHLARRRQNDGQLQLCVPQVLVKAFTYRRVKNDERDAADLADLLRMGRLPEAWIAPREVRELRELTRYRALCRHRHRCRYAEARIMPRPDRVAWGLAVAGVKTSA